MTLRSAWLLALALLAGCSGHQGQLTDTDPDYRREAIAAKTGSGDRSENPTIAAKLLNDPDPMVRAQAAVKLGESRDPEAVQFLAQALTDRDEQVRWDTVEALEKIGERSVAPKVIDVLVRDESANVRRSAARCLGMLGDRAAIPVLIEALSDREYRVSAASAAALAAITGQGFGSDKANWKAWYEGTPSPEAPK